MKREDVDEIAQLLTGMKDSIKELRTALKKKDGSKINAAKMKILDLQIKVGKKL